MQTLGPMALLCPPQISQPEMPPWPKASQPVSATESASSACLCGRDLPASHHAALATAAAGKHAESGPQQFHYSCSTVTTRHEVTRPPHLCLPADWNGRFSNGFSWTDYLLQHPFDKWVAGGSVVRRSIRNCMMCSGLRSASATPTHQPQTSLSRIVNYAYGGAAACPSTGMDGFSGANAGAPGVAPGGALPTGTNGTGGPPSGAMPPGGMTTPLSLVNQACKLEAGPGGSA